MRKHQSAIFHLAIPSADLDRSTEFYLKLGCRVARRYDDRITIEILGHQVVCHLSPDKIDKQPEMYPRHFGITFTGKRSFERLLATALKNKLEFFRDPFVRFKGLPEEHRSFFLKDPSNNLLEFKYYCDPRMMY